MKKELKLYILFIGLLFLGCKERYDPPVTTFNSNLLVVEGFINAGADSTIIKLSRTVLVSNKVTANPETAATVTVESETNETVGLGELNNNKGTYAALGLNLNSSKKYRVRIRTAKGDVYLSDFVEVKLSPAIDKVGWEVKDNGLEVYVNTHDPNNKARYYRWEYDETWIFYARFMSVLVWNGTALVNRDRVNNDIYKCWGNAKSSSILLGSSIKLDQDVIFKQPIIANFSNSERFSERYSILIKQYALTKEAFEFWQNLKKNTESLGSIFGTQPSELTGNIHNVANNAEPVIGYIGAGTVQMQRIYINKAELPQTFRVFVPAECAEPGEAILKAPGDARTYFDSGLNIPIDYSPNGILSSSRLCADCTLRGVNRKPTFWQ